MRLKIIGWFILSATMAVAQKTKALDLNGKWRFTIGDQDAYRNPSYDDSDWEKIDVGSCWENQGFANYNGYGWYRYTFEGAKLKDYQNLMVNLGYIDDVHEAYLNGELIGFKGSFPPDFYTAYDALNEYTLPESSIRREGKNVLAIKIYDIYKEGGLVKGNPAIYFEADAFKDFHSLEGVWKFSTDRSSFWQKIDYRDDDWENIVVPSFWRSKYIKRSDGYGWYRKTFEIPENLKGRDIYLILGKIDDFDYTYVNGKLIGRTKDFLPFGESNSWEQLRIYKIPRELLKQHGTNLIAVAVEDIGIDAGIYNGPVGLASELGFSNR